MKGINFILDAVYVDKTPGRGRGVFTHQSLKARQLVETAPVIVMDKKDRVLLDQTLLHDYIFEWGVNNKQCGMALGYVPLYNHSFRSNCEYEMNFRKQTISILTVRVIAAGEELTINYNGDWNSDKPIWFQAR